MSFSRPHATSRQTHEQFLKDGCDNCDAFLHLRGDVYKVDECTSSNFTGIIAVMDPSDSWVSRWQHVDKMTPGCYAMSVSGKLPGNIVESLPVRYRSRDTSVMQ
eukprot:m.52085 g.52085  ORF g.52085 m.52085 type:complete len:104 (+) comp12264_c1_seq1:277-588(+)